ncbi:hypothetical protein BJY01DRAFT_217937 [Aspergillus pseudoustus]|uniref:Fungal-specific transcription factor domain-containing protein n=1 Tax=Aspergillus pseudoustus TaxID=1810923 RepID=A0ABR4JLW6_9EURO
MSSIPLRPAPAQGGRDFMFVDHQADVSRTNGVRTQKKSFLARHARQKLRQESINRLKYSRPLWSNIPREAKQLERTAPSEDKLEEDNSMQIEGRRHPIFSLTEHVGQGYVDPFDTYSVPMTDAMNMYFHHYRVCVVSSAFPLDGAQMSILWSHNAVVSPGLLQTFLFLAAAHKSALESGNGVSLQVAQRSFRDAIQFRVNAIRTLNDLLQHPVTAAADSTIMLVGSIMAFEGLNAEFEALEAHMKGLAALIDLRTGLDTLSHLALEKIYYSDVINAALRNTRPRFPMLPKFRSGILQEARMFHLAAASDYASDTPACLSSLGTRFSTAAWASELDPSMKYTIGVCRRLLLHIEIANRFPNVVMPTDNDLYLLFQHHLVSLDYPPHPTDLNEPIRQTVLICLYVRVMHLQSFPIMHHMTNALRDTLFCRLPYFKSAAPDLLFWILFIGGIASHGYPPHPWFVAHLRDMAAQLGLEQWDNAQHVLAGFFYMGQPGEGEEQVVEDLWDEMRGQSSFYMT